ncbi:3-hydroxyisobutyryl-CoA hydrolase-like protein 2, mitochondrial isoform C [Glycine soja]|uniref:3-hydroxyisobutyryl-CoA hydrolase n=1 Tax=Glycine soja TaxID=3848 RepID=A0A445GAF1_GLYSO|nr:3-hydroxyisobutyryl-CoA hydrolase-like protein 2, mitochondrial isoform C [Glycine soja]
MQRFKALLPQQTRSSLRTLCSHRRAFSAQPNYAKHHDDDSQEQILVEGRAKSRAAILNRPSSLNSLNASMVARLKRLYDSWEENSDIGFVLMKGSGRAFCSGADVVRLYHSLNEGNTDEAEQFFKTLYSFVYLQGTYLKPHVNSGAIIQSQVGESTSVAILEQNDIDLCWTCMKILWAFMQVAILDGITMGCGSGISLPGMFRVVTDKTVFSHPEAQIGFHPDAGASYVLSRLPGYLGEYLALTGDKLNGVEMIACRLATHYSLNARLSLLEERLGKLITDEPSVVESSLAQYGDLVYPDRSSVLHRIDTIDRCFSHETVEEIIEALEKEAAESNDEWYSTTLRRIREASPLSLKVTLQSIREGRFETLDKCLVREYRMSLRGISKHVSSDFFEGVRARMVDRDFAPKAYLFCPRICTFMNPVNTIFLLGVT